VKHHVHSILGKVGIASRTQMIRRRRPDQWREDGPVRMQG
jgi:DNA-binding NarL/FixJ family response regulator